MLTSLKVLSLILPLVVTLTQPPAEDLVRSIEQQRGGRHWIDQPTDPPKSPAESAACFAIELGFQIELVAAEPLVFDPVAIDFDAAGRMFVAEYGDYPSGPPKSDTDALSQIVLLEDLNHDGKMDRRSVFAQHLKFCHSVLAWGTGVLACTESSIVYLPDDNHDRVADRTETWFEGFTPAHPQMQIGCPRMGLDNRIWCTYGHGKVRCVRPGFESADPVDIPRVDFCFDPYTMKFEAVSGAGQFGNTVDSFGRRFFSSNRNPSMTAMFTLEQVARNPFAGIAAGHTDAGPAGEKTRVYPRVSMKSNWLSHAGTHTSACGVTAYRGGLAGPDSDTSVFVCEPVGHLVTRSVITPDGAGFNSSRARETADFLTSTDTWFRPASLATGPDGSLYLADMYRLWVEHPKFVPDDVAAKMDWRAGEDRGRIWRITPLHSTSTAFRQPQSVADCVALLTDGNGWRRLLGQRLLLEKRDESSIPLLRRLLAAQDHGLPSAFGRLHALWTLHGLHALTPADISIAAEDTFAQVRQDAARLSGIVQDNSVRQRVLSTLLQDPAPGVCFQALLALNSTDANLSATAAKIAATDDPWIQRAFLVAVPESAHLVIHLLAAAPASPDTTQLAVRQDYLRRLAVNTCVHGNLDALKIVADSIRDSAITPVWFRTAVVVGLSEGLPGSRNSHMPKSVSALLQNPPPELADSLAGIRQTLETAAAVAVDRTASDLDRTAAMSLLPQLPTEQLQTAVSSLLSPGESSACQKAAVDVIRRSGRPDLVRQVMDCWSQLTPAARSTAIDLFLSRRDSLNDLLARMQSGDIPAAALSIDQRLPLLQNSDKNTQEIARTLFGGAVSADRQQVARNYAAALSLDADIARGALVFERTCSKCHRVGGLGHNVGPDISDTRARAADALLYDILDPNRRVDPQYTEYIVVTKDGQLLNGLLVSETPATLTLKQPEGRQVAVDRSEIEELRSSNRSLMPEGIEKDVTVQQMADVLAFLRQPPEQRTAGFSRAP
jgi:putative membrane-bound dehydrogenase-like protein